MITYTVLLKETVSKQIAELSKKLQTRVIEAIMALKENPSPHGAISLKAVHSYRKRIGNYRIIYEIHDKIITVFFDVDQRKQVNK